MADTDTARLRELCDRAEATGHAHLLLAPARVRAVLDEVDRREAENARLLALVAELKDDAAHRREG